MRKIVFSITLCAGLALGCSGGKSGGSSGSSLSSTVSSPLTQPVQVSLTAGQNVNGLNIALSSPAGAALNILALGVNPLGLPSGGSAFNNGDTIAQGQSATILIFGPGLASGETISISGPSDIVISNVRSVTSSGGTPGLAFDVVVASTAATGARSVIVTAPDSDVTTFTAGLEVVP